MFLSFELAARGRGLLIRPAVRPDWHPDVEADPVQFRHYSAHRGLLSYGETFVRPSGGIPPEWHEKIKSLA